MIRRFLRRALAVFSDVGSTLGWHGLISGFIALGAFGYGLGMLVQEYRRPKQTEREVLRRVLSNWAQAPDYLGKNLHDYASEWDKALAVDRPSRFRRVHDSLTRLGENLEFHDAQFPLITVVGLRLSDRKGAVLDEWRPQFTPGSSAAVPADAIPIVGDGKRAAIRLEIRYQVAPEVDSVVEETSRYYDRMIRSLIGLSGASLLCFGYMVFHVLALRDRVAREAAREATLDLADRTCHELGNVAFVVSNERRNLASHIELLRRFIAEEPEARTAALDRAGIDPASAARFEHALKREYADREIDPAFELRRSAAMAWDVCRQIAVCSDYMTLTVRELDGFLKHAELPVEIGAIDPAEVFEEASALLAPRLEAADATVFRPAQGESTIRVLADRRLLVHALVNLLKNAVEASSEAPTTIRLSARVEGEIVWLDVADDGPGISEPDPRYLFDDGFSTKGAGRGRGLAIVRESVRLQGGRIRVAARPEGGTVFSIGLPIYRVS